MDNNYIESIKIEKQNEDKCINNQNGGKIISQCVKTEKAHNIEDHFTTERANDIKEEFLLLENEETIYCEDTQVKEELKDFTVKNETNEYKEDNSVFKEIKIPNVATDLINKSNNSEVLHSGNSQNIDINDLIREHNKKIKLNKYKCVECEYTCLRKNQLAIHMESKHDKVKIINWDNYKNAECDKSKETKSSNSPSIDQLIKEHNKKIDKYERQHKLKGFSCGECNYSCSKKNQLINHINSVHDKLKPFKCSHCSYACSYHECLEKHIKRIHSSEKLFKCSLCTRSYSLKLDLNNHVKRVHTPRLYKCPQCSYNSNNKSYFNVHIKKVHKQK